MTDGTPTAILDAIRAAQPVTWINPDRRPYAVARGDIPFESAAIEEARQRLHRWAPELLRRFPEAFERGGGEVRGVPESPLVELKKLPAVLAERYLGADGVDGYDRAAGGTGTADGVDEYDRAAGGTGTADGPAGAAPRILLKLDSHLPISGSIKARGGFHEVLAVAERIMAERKKAAKSTAAPGEARDPAPVSDPGRGHKLAVGSTGNLGLSIGILGAELGFGVTVHMSADARPWKKDLLRSRGVTVIEYASDYGAAVEAGRAAAARDPRCWFVDDERSSDLFLGYATAARPLRAQLEALNVTVDREHPLYVYLPCGVGGGPGGVTFGLMEEFGDHVHCVFAEPTHSPAMLLGMVTGRHDEICVQDLGLDNRTIADGLAVGRPSGLVGPALRRVLHGVYTVTDEDLLALVALVAETEGYRLEPSAVAGLPGPFRVVPDLDHATHLVWATGGSMVPPAEMDGWIARGRIAGGRNAGGRNAGGRNAGGRNAGGRNAGGRNAGT